MKFIVRQLTGKTIEMEAEPSDTIHSIKQRLHEQLNIFPRAQALIFAGRHLEGILTLSDYNIQSGSIINFVFSTGRRRPDEAELQAKLEEEWRQGIAKRCTLRACMAQEDALVSMLNIRNEAAPIHDAIVEFAGLRDADILWEARRRYKIFSILDLQRPEG